MPLWDKTSKLPTWMKGEKKRQTIATDVGFVYRINRFESAANTWDTKDEILVAFAGVANSSNFAAPTISDIWWANNTISANTPATFYVSFDEPIAYANSTIGQLKIGISNTANGTGGLVAVSNTTIMGSNNWIEFTFTPPTAGTYAITGNTSFSNATSTSIASLSSLNAGNEQITLTVSTAQAAIPGSLTVS